MSWQDYIDGPNGLIAKGNNNIVNAGIFGINGATWAQSGLEKLTHAELLELAKLFDDPSTAHMNGFNLCGRQYALLRADDAIIHARGKCGETNPLTVQKTKSAMVIGIGKTDGIPGQVSLAVSTISEHLVNYGY